MIENTINNNLYVHPHKLREIIFCPKLYKQLQGTTKTLNFLHLHKHFAVINATDFCVVLVGISLEEKRKKKNKKKDKCACITD